MKINAVLAKDLKVGDVFLHTKSDGEICAVCQVEVAPERDDEYPEYRIGVHFVESVESFVLEHFESGEYVAGENSGMAGETWVTVPETRRVTTIVDFSMRPSYPDES